MSNKELDKWKALRERCIGIAMFCDDFVKDPGLWNTYDNPEAELDHLLCVLDSPIFKLAV
jgi:hypothetical protein